MDLCLQLLALPTVAVSLRLPLACPIFLGHGSFGRVLQVSFIGSSELYALKVLKKSMIKQKHQEAHLRDERRLLGEMSGCPWIVQLHRTFEDDCNVYMLLEYLKGGELFTLLRRASHLTVQDTIFYASEIVCALDVLHSKGIAYRDLKPENVLLDQYGHVKLVDMGFAKKIGSKKTTTMCGTPEYLAPEIVLGLGHTCAVDWWSLGVLIYELLAGYSPFSAGTFQETYHRISRASYCFPAHFDSHAKDLISKLLAPNPEFRLGSMRGGALDIMSHPFFVSVNWEEVRSWSGKPTDLSDDSASEDTISSTSPSSDGSDSEVQHMFANFDSAWTPQAPAFDLPTSLSSSPLAASSTSVATQSSLFSSNNTLTRSTSTLASSDGASRNPFLPFAPSAASSPIAPLTPQLPQAASHSPSMIGISGLQHIRLTPAEEKITWSQAQGKSAVSHSMSLSSSQGISSPVESSAPATAAANSIAHSGAASPFNAPLVLRTPKKPTIIVKQRKSSRRQTRSTRRQPKSQRSFKGRVDPDFTKSSVPNASVPPLQLARLAEAAPNRHSDLDGYASPHTSPTAETSEMRLSDMFAEEVEVDESQFSSPESSPRELGNMLPAPSPFVPHLASSPAFSTFAAATHVMPSIPPLATLSSMNATHAPTSFYVAQAPIASTTVPTWGFLTPMQLNPYYTSSPLRCSTMPRAAMNASFPTPLPPKACHRPHVPPFVPSDEVTADDTSLFDHYSEDAALHLPLHRSNCPASCSSNHTHLETLVFGSHGTIVHRYGQTEVPCMFNHSER